LEIRLLEKKRERGIHEKEKRGGKRKGDGELAARAQGKG